MALKTEYRHVGFEMYEQGALHTKWECLCQNHGTVSGIVYWDNKFRTYSFKPRDGTSYDVVRLNEIGEFCRLLGVFELKERRCACE